MNITRSHQKIYMKELFRELKSRFNSAKRSKNFQNKILIYVDLIEALGFIKYPEKTSSERFMDILKNYSDSQITPKQIKWIYKTIRCSIVHYGFIPSLSINRNITRTIMHIELTNGRHIILSIPLREFESMIKNSLYNLETEFRKSQGFQNDFVKLRYKVCNDCKNYFMDNSTNNCPFCSEEY